MDSAVRLSSPLPDPAAAARACRIARACRAPGAGAGPDQRFLGVRVLLVDDQRLNLEVASELLACRGVVVDLADDGQAAVDLLLENEPGTYDLVLMDIEMPLLDGLAATRQIRSRQVFDDLPVIALTAHVTSYAADDYWAAGVDDQLAKPFSPNDLYATVARWVSPKKQAELPAPTLPEAPPPNAAVREYDWESALARFGQRPDRLDHWLRCFIAERRHAGKEILAKTDSGDLLGAAKVAHALKGVAGTLGLHRLFQACSRLENDLRNGRARSPAMVAMQTALARAVEHVERRLADAPAVVPAAAQNAPPTDAEQRGEELAGALATLRELLATGDGGSEEQAERCLQLAEPPLAQAMQVLLAPIRSFDFAAALRVLDELALPAPPTTLPNRSELTT